jgi:dissimilatory sulfite reductase (desulfoviridin) alpha/beta subunit
MRCAYIKANGDQCGAQAMKNDQFCFSHNPKSKKKHQLAVIKGGKLSRRDRLDLPPVEVRTPEHVVAILEETINGVRSGSISPSIANTLAYVCSHALRAMEVSNLDERLEVIESVLMSRRTTKKGHRYG